jgi:uncharacterized membrane protein YfcA
MIVSSGRRSAAPTLATAPSTATTAANTATAAATATPFGRRSVTTGSFALGAGRALGTWLARRTVTRRLRRTRLTLLLAALLRLLRLRRL